MSLSRLAPRLAVLSTLAVTFALALGINAALADDPPPPQVYWTDRETSSIYRADADGANVETVLDETDGLTRPSDIAIGDGKIYWTDPTAAKVSRADLDGSDIEVIADATDGVQIPEGVALDFNAGKVYWA